MRVVAIALSVAALVTSASCGGSDEPVSGATSSKATSTAASTTGPNPLVGEWERVTTCREMIEALEQAGFGSNAVVNMVGNGFIPGVQSVVDLKDPNQPCKGAVPRKHSHFFTEDGLFGSRDWNGEQVDDGTYRVVDADTLVISKEFPDVEFRYRIEGDGIVFDPAIPDDCVEFRCEWAVSMAYPGKKWTRTK